MNEYYKIEDICKVKGGKRIPQGETLQLEQNEHPYIRILDMYQGRVINLNNEMQYAKDSYWNQISSYIVNTGDVILAIVGNTLGMVSIIGETLNNANLTENCCKFVDLDEKKVLPMFLYYSLKSPLNQKQIDVFRVGSSQPKLPIYNINQLVVPKYSIEVQQKIINILADIDSKIENNNKINAELESMAKTIYDYWFLQFEFPNEDGKPYKSSGGKMVWNEELKREIPEGWEVNNLAKAIFKSKNGDWGNEEPVNDDDIKVNCFRGADFISITNDYQMTAPIRYIKKNNADRLLEDGDLVTEISGGSPTQATGRIGYINQGFLNRSENVMDCSNFCKAFTPIDRIYQYWLYQTWKSYYDNGAMFNYESKTTGIKNLMFDEFIDSIYVAYPNEELLEVFQNKCTLFYEKIQKNLLENQELASLRDFLLPLLMNGQIGFK